MGANPSSQYKDANREADAWAICAASFDVTAEVLAGLSQPAQSKQLQELANGAELAVGISLVMNELSTDITPERFNTIWAFSQMAMEAWPASKRTMIMADAERMGKDGFEEFMSSLGETNKICISNLETQQMYIDIWRDLYNPAVERNGSSNRQTRPPNRPDAPPGRHLRRCRIGSPYL